MYLTKISYYSIFLSIGSVFCSRPEDVELPDDDGDATSGRWWERIGACECMLLLKDDGGR